jgi:hypothetical protein
MIHNIECVRASTCVHKCAISFTNIFFYLKYSFLYALFMKYQIFARPRRHCDSTRTISKVTNDLSCVLRWQEFIKNVGLRLWCIDIWRDWIVAKSVEFVLCRLSWIYCSGQNFDIGGPNTWYEPWGTPLKLRISYGVSSICSLTSSRL